MSDIRLLKDNLQQISSANIIRLISDVLLWNIDKIDIFKTSSMYYKDDVVYKYDTTINKHKLYICKRKTLNPGAFNAADWTEYVFNFVNTKVVLESEFVATVDNTSNCPINQSLYDYERDYLVVNHSLRGRLRKDKDWTISNDRLSVNLVGFALYKNESLLFEVFK